MINYLHSDCLESASSHHSVGSHSTPGYPYISLNDLPTEMFSDLWTDEDVFDFFDSNGKVRPPPPGIPTATEGDEPPPSSLLSLPPVKGAESLRRDPSIRVLSRSSSLESPRPPRDRGAGNSIVNAQQHQWHWTCGVCGKRTRM